MKLRRKPAFTCKACGSAMTGDEVRHCEVCLKKRCPNCVVEIAGRTICTECKAWALEKLEAGLPLTPDDKLFSSVEEIREKRKEARAQRLRDGAGKIAKMEAVRDRVLFRHFDPFMLFYMGFLFLGLAGGGLYMSQSVGTAGLVVIIIVLVLFLLFISLALPKLLTRNVLRTVHVDDWGISGTTFGGEKKEIAWEEMTAIVMRRPRPEAPGGGMSGFIKVEAGKERITIKDNFPRFVFITELVSRVCQEKEITYVEKWY
jgi:hypothetical protein